MRGECLGPARLLLSLAGRCARITAMLPRKRLNQPRLRRSSASSSSSTSSWSIISGRFRRRPPRLLAVGPVYHETIGRALAPPAPQFWGERPGSGPGGGSDARLLPPELGAGGPRLAARVADVSRHCGQ